MSEIIILLKPRWLSIKNRRSKSMPRYLLFGTLGVLFWSGIFYLSLRILSYFQSIEEIGDILAWKLLSMVMILYFALLIFSSLLTALSKLYLSKDLPLVHSMPVAGWRIFAARWVECALDSSWTIIIFTLPVLISYGIIYGGGVFYYTVTALVLVLLSAAASLASALIVMFLVMVIPPGRVRSIFVFLGLLLFLLLYLAFRLMRPERLADPEAFHTVLAYIQVLKTPSTPWLPTTWSFDAVKSMLFGRSEAGLFNLALLAVFTAILAGLAVQVADCLYWKGFSKSQTARQTWRKSSVSERPGWLFFLPRPVRAYAEKEIKTFFRDQTQWSQIFLILALIVIYLYNFKVLPLERAPIKTVYLQNLLSFLNMGLAAFVLTAVTGRFVYPAISIEGEAFWIVRCAPMRLKSFLWIKFCIYLVPLFLLTQFLIVATNLLLKVTPFMMGLSVITTAVMVPAVAALGIGLGAAYPDFSSENPAQSITSFGGLVFMILSALYITAVIILEAGPVYHIFMSGMRGRPLTLSAWLWVVGSFAAVAAVSLFTLVYPMKYGEKRLASRAYRTLPSRASGFTFDPLT